ncbi:hypothetical protein BaDB11_01764 [Bacillus licheniformis]|jgi:hypothetical protein|nr:hypothetical protein BaDB11_01764 [Bacillus licheniformis]
MLLYYKNECLGEIKGATVEGVWMYGTIIPN